MNSFRFVKAGLEFEIKRQRANLAAGREIVQETRLWDTAQNQTFSMRGKEEAHDYRYFPDPDLVPVRIDPDWLEALRKNLAELPKARLQRFQAEYGLPEYDAEVLTSDKALADYFEATAKLFPHPKKVSNYIMGDVLRELKKGEAGIASFMSTLTPATSASMLNLVEDGTISGKIAKTVFDEMVATGRTRGYRQRKRAWCRSATAGPWRPSPRRSLPPTPRKPRISRPARPRCWAFSWAN